MNTNHKKKKAVYFHITHSTDLSLHDLLRKMREGYSVVKTPHAGNFYPNNLLFAQLGIPMNIFNYNVAGKDKNFHPQYQIVGGAMQEVAEWKFGQISSFMRLKKECMRGRFEECARYDRANDLHMHVLKSIYPQGVLYTYSEYLRNH
ncbi:MAG: hypothetical protein KDC37_01610, partial [Flavobacteriales bacterium]|nr:hypothetical protein [Flavobacteriales bacterium]